MTAKAFRFLALDLPDADALLEAYLCAFAQGDPVCLTLGVPPERLEPVSQRLEGLITSWGFDPETIPDVELTPCEPDAHALLRATASSELTGVLAPRDLRKLAGLSTHAAPPEVSIVVSGHHPARTKRCLTLLRRFTRHAYELIVVTDVPLGGPDDARVVLRDEPGDAWAFNQGMARARGRHILLLSDAVMVTEGWLDRLLAHAEAHPEAGILGPVSLNQAMPEPRTAREQALCHAGQTREVESLAPCLLVTRDVLARIGGLDDRSHATVDDYVRRARRTGATCLRCEDTLVYMEDAYAPPGTEIESGVDRVPLPAPLQDDLTSIVILGFNQLAYTQLCIESVFRATREPYELILVDNGSTDGTTEYFKALARRHPFVTAILNEQNLGFAGGCNQGIIAARGGQILLLNNDTLVSDGWLSPMLGKLREDPRWGIVGPVSNYVSGPQCITEVPYGDEVDAIAPFAERWSKDHEGQGFAMDRIVGFCMLIRRDVIARIGGFDTRFGNGNFEDDDFCLRARVAGYQIWVCQDVFVHHFGSRTFRALGDKADYRHAMDIGWDLFKEKWGLPAELPRQRDYPMTSLLAGAFNPGRHVVDLLT